MEYNNPNDPWMYDPYKGIDEKERIMASLLQVVSFIIMTMVCLLLCALLGSCTTTKYVEVPVIEHKTDTVYQNTVQRDSVFLHDSIMVTQYQKGDTIYQESIKWHTKYVLKEVRDTTYVSRIDSVPAPYPVIKEVPAKLTWWQQTRLHLANIVLWLAAICAIVYIGKRHINSILP
jgi:hypothetical protein